MAKKMTAKCALAMALLEGRVLNIANCFKEIGLSNIGREIPRLIEKPFGLVVSRTPRTGKSRYGQGVSYTDYRLNVTSYNREGIEKLKAYCKEHMPSQREAKTDKEATIYKQQELFLNQL